MEFEHKLEYFVQSRGFGNDGTPGFNLSLDLFGCRGARRNRLDVGLAIKRSRVRLAVGQLERR